jgi:hypothetical protein
MRNRRRPASLEKRDASISVSGSGKAAKSGALAAAAAVVAMGAFGAATTSCSKSGADECTTQRAFFEQNVWSAFMSTKCAKCHSPDGIAHTEHNAKFILQPSSYPGFIDANLANLAMVSKIQFDGQSELLLKPLGQLGHFGGAQLESGSDDYKALTSLVGQLSNIESCTTGADTTLSPVSLSDGPSTLRRASLDLVGRLPTAAEKAAVTSGGDVALDAALDGMMKEEAFFTRVREIFNDLLLTDRFLSYSGAAIDTMNTDDYPGLAPYRDSNNPAYNSDARPLINKAIAREPLDLIVYLLKNGKPFTDVVGADYTVVNPFSAIAYGVDKTILFKDVTDYNEFHEAKITIGTDLRPIPHAGVLSTPAFLNRWQTSPTNRNRGRARRVFQFFLATDVLKIATRPVDATKVTATENPTHNSEYCTVCHNVIDPVAGGFRGWDDNDYEDFDPARPWHDEMFEPGFGTSTMDPNYYTKALQWLGPEVAADPRFSISAVRTVYKGLTGHDPIEYPTDNTDPNFATLLASWSAQDAFFRGAAADFAKKPDLKAVFKTVIKSPYYRAVSVPDDMDPGLLKDVGLGRLLTPEMLNRKIKAITGYSWRKTYDWTNQHDYLQEDYNILYGGIDSESTITRLTTANGLIASVSSRMANESACAITGWDFTKGKAVRAFFPFVDLSEMPESSGHTVDGSVADIKKNIQFLHQLFLDEKLDIGDPEIDRTYQLFLDTWHELSQAGDKGLDCDGRRNPIDGTDLPDAQQIKDDPNFTLRSWQAVMTYLMSDYKFLYE